MSARRPRLLAYASGGFGLALSAQVAFLVPLLARDLGAGFDVIGLVVGAGAVAAFATSLPAGAMIDRLGARRCFVVGAGCTGTLLLLFPLVTDYWALLGLQPALGVARNLAWTASQSHITSVGTEAERPTLTGRFSVVSNAGQMVGPILVGSAAGAVGLRWAFVVSAAYALVFLLVGLFLDDPPCAPPAPDTGAKVGLRATWDLLGIAGLQVAVLLTFARLWITSVYTTFLPVVLVDDGLEPGVVGVVVATSGLVGAAVAPTAGFWTRYRSQAAVAVAALLCGSAGLVLAAHVTTMPWVFGVPVLIGLGSGVSWPLLLTIGASAAPAQSRGMALGLRAMAAQAALTAAPVIVGPLVSVLGLAAGFTAAGAVTACMVAGTGLLVRGARGAWATRPGSAANPAGDPRQDSMSEPDAESQARRDVAGRGSTAIGSGPSRRPSGR